MWSCAARKKDGCAALTPRFRISVFVINFLCVRLIFQKISLIHILFALKRANWGLMGGMVEINNRRLQA